MHKASNMLKWLSAVVLLIMLFLPAWNCIDIYAKANQAAEDANGLTEMYQADDLQQRLSAMARPMTALLCVEVIIGITLQFLPEKKNTAVRDDAVTQQSTTSANIAVVRWSVLIAAFVLIVLGVMNGGLYDVFVKAINICTECIGLG